MSQNLIDALVCTKPGELVIAQRPAPIPLAGEVLVRPRRVGICGTDYHIFEGKHPFLELSARDGSRARRRDRRSARRAPASRPARFAR